MSDIILSVLDERLGAAEAGLPETLTPAELLAFSGLETTTNKLGRMLKAAGVDSKVKKN